MDGRFRGRGRRSCHLAQVGLKLTGIFLPLFPGYMPACLAPAGSILISGSLSWLRLLADPLLLGISRNLPPSPESSSALVSSRRVPADSQAPFRCVCAGQQLHLYLKDYSQRPRSPNPSIPRALGKAVKCGVSVQGGLSGQKWPSASGSEASMGLCGLDTKT